MGKEERGARELPQRVPLTGDEDGAALSQRGRGRRTLIRSVESQMRPIYQPLFLRQLIAGLPRICDPGAYRNTPQPVLGKGDLDHLQFPHRYKTELTYNQIQRFFVTK